MKNVCQGCTERVAEPNCHMTCERYLAERDKLERKKELIRKGKEKDDYKIR